MRYFFAPSCKSGLPSLYLWQAPLSGLRLLCLCLMVLLTGCNREVTTDSEAVSLSFQQVRSYTECVCGLSIDRIELLEVEKVSPLPSEPAGGYYFLVRQTVYIDGMDPYEVGTFVTDRWAIDVLYGALECREKSKSE
jgi:hypothetical protein